MTEQQTIVEGQRTIARHPEAPDDHRWWGAIDAKGYRERVWKASHPESVVKQMDQTLGQLPNKDDGYVVTE